MAKSTLIIVGPGGAGKSPIDKLVRSDVVRLDPYRLRTDGPRDREDRLYVSPKLHNELASVFEGFADNATIEKDAGETVEWYPKAGVAFFTVRGEWQCLIIPNNMGTLAKMEIYAPVLPLLLSISQFASILGNCKIIVLNPAPESLLLMGDWTTLENKTEHNCRERGDSEQSTQKRVKSVVAEAPYWRELVKTHGAIEAVDWQFPEYVYKRDTGASQKAKQCLLSMDGGLAQFF